MPIFDFHCNACGKDSELLVRASADPVCPACGSTDLGKQLSAPPAPGKSTGILRQARAQAAREGHFSNYKPSEIRKK